MPDLGMASRKMGGGSGNGGFRTATPFTSPKRLARLPSAPSSCPSLVGAFSESYICMAPDASAIYADGAVSNFSTYTYPGLAYVSSTSYSSFATGSENTAWGPWYVMAIDDDGYLYNWLYNTGWNIPVLYKFLPDGSSSTRLYEWPYGMNQGGHAPIWHPSDPDGIYSYVNEYDPTGILGTSVDSRKLVRNDRATGARTDILTGLAGSDYYFPNLYGFNEYSTGLSFLTNASTGSGGFPVDITVYDIPTDTTDTLAFGTPIRAFAGNQAGAVWFCDNMPSPTPDTWHKAQITVSGGAVSIAEVDMTCEDVFNTSTVGDFQNWISNGDRSLVLNYDNTNLWKFP